MHLPSYRSTIAEDLVAPNAAQTLVVVPPAANLSAKSDAR